MPSTQPAAAAAASSEALREQMPVSAVLRSLLKDVVAEHECEAHYSKNDAELVLRNIKWVLHQWPASRPATDDEVKTLRLELCTSGVQFSPPTQGTVEDRISAIGSLAYNLQTCPQLQDQLSHEILKGVLDHVAGGLPWLRQKKLDAGTGKIGLEESRVFRFRAIRCLNEEFKRFQLAFKALHPHPVLQRVEQSQAKLNSLPLPRDGIKFLTHRFSKDLRRPHLPMSIGTVELEAYIQNLEAHRDADRLLQFELRLVRAALVQPREMSHSVKTHGVSHEPYARPARTEALPNGAGESAQFRDPHYRNSKFASATSIRRSLA